MPVHFNLHTQALSLERNALVKSVIKAALQAADPYEAVCRYVRKEDNNLVIGESLYPVNSLNRVIAIGFGKASLAMAAALEDTLGSLLNGGVVICKHLPTDYPLRLITSIKGNHPIPGSESLHNTQILLSLLSGLVPEDLVICLISGGGSALLTQPQPGIGLDDMQEATRQLLASGASIQEINILRKHIDAVKGGGLWRKTQPAQTATLILSDVVGDDLDTIASGPMVPDKSTYPDAWSIIKKYKLEEGLPSAIITWLQAGLDGKTLETLKVDDYIPENNHLILVGSNQLAAQAAVKQAEQSGFHAVLVTTSLTGEARTAGQNLAVHARELQAFQPACHVFGGETTVTLTGNGRGGRNQEVALAAVPGLAGLPEIALVTLATDGEDGPTDAAGAVVTENTYKRAANVGLDSMEYLSRNDAYQFFESLGDLIITGPTGTNVNDLNFIFKF